MPRLTTDYDAVLSSDALDVVADRVISQPRRTASDDQSQDLTSARRAVFAIDQQLRVLGKRDPQRYDLIKRKDEVQDLIRILAGGTKREITAANRERDARQEVSFEHLFMREAKRILSPTTYREICLAAHAVKLGVAAIEYEKVEQ